MNSKIPVTIGITGHRDIAPASIPEIKKLVTEEILKLKEHNPSCSFVMLDSLASGADLLCAEIAMELGIPLTAVLPVKEEDYISDFSEEDAGAHIRALKYASSVIICGGSTRDESYRNAGLYVADHSHVLFALWDGKTGSADGCGTADIVYAVQHSQEIYAIDHVSVPRSGEVCLIKSELIESEPGILERILNQTEEFNAEEDHGSLYDKADGLSVSYQKKYMKRIGLLALTGVALVLCFLLYDELGWVICLPLYAVLLLAGAFILREGNRNRYHEKYINYRLLAECLRVQGILDISRTKGNAADFYTWTQEEYSAWIKKAIDAIAVSKDASDDGSLCPDLASVWLKDQLDYHYKALERNTAKQQKNASVTKLFSVLTVIFIAAALILEFFAKDVINAQILGLPLSLYLKLAVGLFSASSLFLSLYYGKQSLERKITDNNNMIRLYRRALSLAEENGLDSVTIKKIAGEEIIETGNWYSYSRENKLDINI